MVRNEDIATNLIASKSFKVNKTYSCYISVREKFYIFEKKIFFASLSGITSFQGIDMVDISYLTTTRLTFHLGVWREGVRRAMTNSRFRTPLAT